MGETCPPGGWKVSRDRGDLTPILRRYVNPLLSLCVYVRTLASAFYWGADRPGCAERWVDTHECSTELGLGGAPQFVRSLAFLSAGKVGFAAPSSIFIAAICFCTLQTHLEPAGIDSGRADLSRTTTSCLTRRYHLLRLGQAARDRRRYRENQKLKSAQLPPASGEPLRPVCKS
jgi:hypothetical protein